jgi:thiamine-phosphate pyrophosphorylase
MPVPRRQPLPRIWLMTDERIDDLDAAIAALPRGSGIIFRHDTLMPQHRRVMFKAVRRTARACGHMLLSADRPGTARQWGADGAHERSARASQGLRTVAVHSVRERIIAARAGADLIFVSPVCPTRSHPGAKPIGRIGFLRIAGPLRHRAIMLGGMNAGRFRRMAALKPYGWAAIDALSTPKGQNLKAVPT